MDSMAGPVEPGLDYADSPNVRIVKAAFDALDESGLEAAIEHLLTHADADVEFSPYAAGGRILRGPDEVRAFYRGELADGTVYMARPSSIEESGDEVVVNGSLRVLQPTGGFAESQIRWTYRFRDGRLHKLRGGPRQAA
jgi:ketosteroid isomerase-like protein